MIKILKLIDDDQCLKSDLYSCQVERKQKNCILGNFYNQNPCLEILKILEIIRF